MPANLSLTEENYLKAIFALSNETNVSVNTSSLAKYISIASSSVTDMLKKLSEKGYIAYEKYQGVTLTSEGRKIAINIVRKHRLWEVFLVEKLNFQWDEVHDIAEQLEHIQSTELTARLYEYLERPQFDPHGDPIPNEKGEFPNVNRQKLSEFSPGESVRILGVNDDSPAFLQYLQQIGLTLGTELKIETKLEHDQSMWIKVNNQQLMLSKISCQNIFCRAL
jgi:DtxR family transcriptional regulator, Mn-dependent transcriptional regulator